jgi:hypothetical protein
MGVLRTYVKQNQPQKDEKWNRKNRKHPKDLKILNYFDIDSRSLVNL